MFNKKKQPEQQVKQYDYTKWESDFGFLLLMINRKCLIAREFNIKIFASQLQNNNDFIHDKDIEKIYQDTVNDVYSSLSKTYTDFLIDKYFGSDQSLIGFIAENILDDLIKSSVEQNNEKIKKQYSTEMSKIVTDLNTDKKKGK